MLALFKAGIVLAETICNLPGCSVCKGVDPDSWEWIYKGCWMFGSSAPSAMGVGLVMAAMVGVMSLSLRQPRVR